MEKQNVDYTIILLQLLLNSSRLQCVHTVARVPHTLCHFWWLSVLSCSAPRWLSLTEQYGHVGFSGHSHRHSRILLLQLKANGRLTVCLSSCKNLFYKQTIVVSMALQRFLEAKVFFDENVTHGLVSSVEILIMCWHYYGELIGVTWEWMLLNLCAPVQEWSWDFCDYSCGCGCGTG